MFSSAQLISYLVSTGWVLTHVTRVKSKVFSHKDHTDTVIIPTDKNLGDYQELLAKALRLLSMFEEVSVDRIVEKVIFCKTDILRYKADSRFSRNGTLFLPAWEKHYEFTLRSIKAAASCIAKPTKKSKRLNSKDAADFASKCRIGQTEIGSYITKAIIPLGDYQPELGDESKASVLPFGRQLASSIVKGVRIVSAAAHEIQQRDGLFDSTQYNSDRPLMYICERLCSAYEDAAEAFNNNLNLSVALAPSPTLPLLHEDISTPAVLCSKFLVEIKEFHRVIARDFKPIFSTVTGFVVSLNSEVYKDDVDCGSIVIRDSDGKKMHLTLPTNVYKAAIKAHDSKRPISVCGVVRKIRRRFYIENPSDFTVL